jgi:cytochrome b involved in lipid metabolism
MKKIILIIAGSIGVFGIVYGGWYYSNFQKYAPTTYVSTTSEGVITTNTKTGEVTPGSPVFSLSDIASHKDQVSCYTAISGSIYDLTQFVNMHPGGKEPILFVCGKDGTEVFMNQHHGLVKYMKVLARYKVGALQ